MFWFRFSKFRVCCVFLHVFLSKASLFLLYFQLFVLSLVVTSDYLNWKTRLWNDLLSVARNGLYIYIYIISCKQRVLYMWFVLSPSDSTWLCCVLCSELTISPSFPHWCKPERTLLHPTISYVWLNNFTFVVRQCFFRHFSTTDDQYFTNFMHLFYCSI